MVSQAYRHHPVVCVANLPQQFVADLPQMKAVSLCTYYPKYDISQDVKNVADLPLG